MGKSELVFASYKFTTEENLRNAHDLTDAMHEADRLESNLNTIKQEFKFKLAAAEAQIGKMRQKVATGEESREYECEVVLDHTDHRRFYFDIHTGELIKSEPFHAEDYQGDLFSASARYTDREGNARRDEYFTRTHAPSFGPAGKDITPDADIETGEVLEPTALEYDSTAADADGLEPEADMEPEDEPEPELPAEPESDDDPISRYLGTDADDSPVL